MVRDGYRLPEMSATGLLKIFNKSYADREIRTLAQEPVQNAKDARHGNEIVHVEYRLMRRMPNSGKPFYILSVTDRGTTGLCGNTYPSQQELQNTSEEERQQLKWYHFERLFDSNKNSLHSGSRGWGKSAFLDCSRIPEKQRSAMMLYDTLLQDGEYRFSDMTILNDEFGVRKQPLLNDEARQAVSGKMYITPDGSIKLPLALDPLCEPGTRIIVPFLARSSVEALRNGTLRNWLQYLWWCPVADKRLNITIVDEEMDKRHIIEEPEWCDLWSSDASTPDAIHKLYEGCYIQKVEDVNLGKGCAIKRLALLYDSELRDRPSPSDGPNYIGIQMFRAEQCIETYWDFDLIPSKEKTGIRAFVEFDEATDKMLREKEKTQHDGFRKSGIVKNPVLPYLQSKVNEFATEIGLIKSQSLDDGRTNEKFRSTSQFVFDRLLSKLMGDIPVESTEDTVPGGSDNPWDVDVLLSYPNPDSSRVDWGQRITNIRFVVNSRPKTPRRNTRFTIEWQAPGKKYVKLLSKSDRLGTEYGLGYRVLTKHEVKDHHIICQKPGIYRICAAVYEGKTMVAKKARRIHVETDPPERDERPYAVSISVVNETTPKELRIENGDILRLQINGRNRTHEEVTGHLHLRTKEGQILLESQPFYMPGKPVGQDDRRHPLYKELRIRVVRGEPGEPYLDFNVLTLPLEPGKRVIQANLLDGTDDLAFGSHTLHFESEPPRTQGGLPFEPFQVLSGTPPMWELRIEESKLCFAADYPIHTALLQNSTSESFDGHNPFELEINVNGLLQWALEPLSEDKVDPTRIESLRDAKPDLVDDEAWDRYMECLSELEADMKNYVQGQPVSPIDFALKWRKTVAAIHPILIPQEHD